MKFILTLIVGLVVLHTAPAFAQDVIKYDGDRQDLDARWSWAESKLDGASSNTWIGYSIERLMSENSSMGRYSSKSRRQSYGELLYGIKPTSRKNHSERKVTKEVVMIFQLDRSGGVTESRFSTLDGEANSEGDILWLGMVENSVSLDKVAQLFNSTTDSDAKEHMTAAIAMHDSKKAVSMLTGVLNGDDDSEVRAQAAFWMSQFTDAELVLDDLVRAAKRDRSEEVQEQAVFAISQVDGDRATDSLIELAKNGPSDIQDESIFWLGQKASDKAIESLAEIIEDDPNIEVKKQALFALSQQDSDDGLDRLIDIAKKHENRELRKEAIFWLSQSDDPAALDAIVDIVKR